MPHSKKHINNLIKKIASDTRVRIEAATKSHSLFFPIYFSHYMEYETADFQHEMFAMTEDDETNLHAIVAFRGSAKSTIFTMSLPLWAILGRMKKKFVVIGGQTQQKAQQYLLNIKRELESNELLKKDLGPFREERNQWGAHTLVIPRFDAKIVAFSSEQSIRSLRHGPHRPDLIILDDVEDLESVKTREGRDKTWQWVNGDVIPAGTINSRVIVVGNLLHEDSLMKRLQKRIESGKTDGIYREYPLLDAETEEPLWPGKYPDTETIEREKQRVMDYAAWQREFLLTILPDEHQIIRREWIKYYDDMPPLQDYYAFTAVGIDPAISQKDTADYTAMVAGRVFGKKREEMMIYILPNPINKRLTSLQTIEKAKVLSMGLALKGDAELYVEDVAYQRSLIEHLSKDGFPVTSVKLHGQDKHARLNAVSYLLESGRILFPKEGAEELIGQMVHFGVEKHDDLADAFSILISEIIDKINRGRVGRGLAEGPIEWGLLSSREKKVLEEQGIYEPKPERRLKPESMRPTRFGPSGTRMYDEDDFF